VKTVGVLSQMSQQRRHQCQPPAFVMAGPPSPLAPSRSDTRSFIYMSFRILRGKRMEQQLYHSTHSLLHAYFPEQRDGQKAGRGRARRLPSEIPLSLSPTARWHHILVVASHFPPSCPCMRLMHASTPIPWRDGGKRLDNKRRKSAKASECRRRHQKEEKTRKTKGKNGRRTRLGARWLAFPFLSALIHLPAAAATTTSSKKRFIFKCTNRG
jgi:hypothetical protein